MAKHIVKCLYCGKEFDANEEEYVKPRGNRYAHKECAEKEELRQGIIKQIHEKMQRLLGQTYNSQKIDREIKKFVKEGKTEAGILRTLEFWYDIQGHTTEKANGGIAIVEWVYGDAMSYYSKMNKYKKMQESTDIKDYITETQTLVFKPKPIQKPKGVRLFNLD